MQDTFGSEASGEKSGGQAAARMGAGPYKVQILVAFTSAPQAYDRSIRPLSSTGRRFISHFLLSNPFCTARRMLSYHGQGETVNFSEWLP